MKITGKLSGNMSFDIDQNGHTIIVDSDVQFGGEGKGPSPKGLLISGLIGCTGMDVVSILRKMKVDFADLEITAETEYTDEHPRVFRDITLKYFLTGENLDISKVKRAVELSQTKYCGVSAMLSFNRVIKAEIFINGNKAS